MTNDPDRRPPTGGQWEQATVDQYVWGSPEKIHTYGAAVDAAGQDLIGIADALRTIAVDDFWTGTAATAFTQLKESVHPAVRGLGESHTDTAKALDTWQRHLGTYREDCATAVTTGRGGYSEWKATHVPEGQTAMSRGRSGISAAQSSRNAAAATCKAEIDSATSKAGPAPAPPPPPAQTNPTGAQPTSTGSRPALFTPVTGTPPFLVGTNGHPPMPNQLSTTPGQVGQAPSGREPVPAMGPFPADRPWPYVDPANGRYVRPVLGISLPGGQRWEYVN